MRRQYAVVKAAERTTSTSSGGGPGSAASRRPDRVPAGGHRHLPDRRDRQDHAGRRGYHPRPGPGARPGPGQPDRYADPGKACPARWSPPSAAGSSSSASLPGTWASASVVAGLAAPIGSAWLPSAWHRGPCPCGHYALPGDAAWNHAAYYRHVAAPW